MTISLIVTTKNEAASAAHLLASIAGQIQPPDEIIIVDGGSTDCTVEILQSHATAAHLSLKIMSQRGANISQGRNAAIRASSGDIICSTDAGVHLSSNWVKELVAPLRQSENDVVAGFFLPDPRSVFETALAATTLPALEDVNPQKFLPSSRSIAFRKRAWEEVGGYPEWLDYCEDLIFDFALRAAGCRFAFAPRAVAYFRPRETLGAFFRQYYRYARGDGKAHLWLKRHLVRYTTYLLALPLAVVLIFTAPLLAAYVWAFAAIALFYTPYKRLVPLMRQFSFVQMLTAIAWVPVIRITGDIAKMAGYPAGLLWRLKRNKTSF